MKDEITIAADGVVIKAREEENGDISLIVDRGEIVYLSNRTAKALGAFLLHLAEEKEE